MTEILKNPAVSIPFLALVAYSAYELTKYLVQRMRQRPMPADDPFLKAFGKAFGIEFTVRGDSCLTKLDKYCVVAKTMEGGNEVCFGDMRQFGYFNAICGTTRQDAQKEAREYISAEGTTMWVRRVDDSKPMVPIESEFRKVYHDVYRLPGFSSIDELKMKASICGGIEQWKT